jgi:hypothetical protein
MAITGLIVLTPADRNHRRARHVCVAQAGREIRRADVLRQADARTVRRACISVGHVRGSLFAVRDHTFDADLVHLLHRGAHYGVHIEQMCHAVTMHRFGKVPVPAHFRHHSSPDQVSISVRRLDRAARPLNIIPHSSFIVNH